MVSDMLPGRPRARRHPILSGYPIDGRDCILQYDVFRDFDWDAPFRVRCTKRYGFPSLSFSFYGEVMPYKGEKSILRIYNNAS